MHFAFTVGFYALPPFQTQWPTIKSQVSSLPHNRVPTIYRLREADKLWERDYEAGWKPVI